MLHNEGPLLTIDVGTRETTETDISEVNETFVGGRGVATKLAYERIPVDADPLGPENALYFTTGPMQASMMSFTGRMNATAVSPLTDGLLSSNAGGFMSRNFADTGYGAVELTGQSDELVAVHVRDDGVEFETVPELEAATVEEITEHAEENHDLSEEHVAAIGPAGENLVRFACIMTTEKRAFGRGGLGAVLGSKNVKYVSFAGDSSHDIEIPDLQMDVHREASQSDSIMKRQGTTSVTDLANEVEALPTRYFADLHYDKADTINGARVEEKKFKRGTCSSCAFACKLPTRDEETGLETEGPEYETVMSFGSNPMVDDIVDVMQSNELCDDLGMDTISCGNTVTAYLAAEDEFGNVDLIHDLVEKIAYREGEGDMLAEGIDRVHDELGVENWTMKGMDFSAHDGRTLNGQGLAFCTANRGGDHMYATFYAWEYPLVSSDQAMDPTGLEGKPPRVVRQENARAIEDCGIVCRFSRGMMTEERWEGLFDADYEDLQAIGHRVVTLERHFNNQRGFDRADDDDLPYELEGIEAALDEYYDTRGWNADGTVPEDLAESAAAVGTGPAPADD